MIRSLPETVFLLILGFLFTGVFGALLASWLQRRLWRHQWTAQRENERLEATRALFEEVSRLMDKRLFRLSQFHLWLGRDDAMRRQAALEDYRAILFEWNDSINRNLSLLQYYFSPAIRQTFDHGVGKDFVELGASSEKLYRLLPELDAEADVEFRAGLENLKTRVYNFNLAMLKDIDDRLKAAAPLRGTQAAIRIFLPS